MRGILKVVVDVSFVDGNDHITVKNSRNHDCIIERKCIKIPEETSVKVAEVLWMESLCLLKTVESKIQNQCTSTHHRKKENVQNFRKIQRKLYDELQLQALWIDSPSQKGQKQLNQNSRIRCSFPHCIFQSIRAML